MLPARPQKSQYTEDEAAKFLEVSVEQLRTLVHKHILNDEETDPASGLAVYQRSDLLLLRLLRSQQVTAWAEPLRVEPAPHAFCPHAPKE
jgi:hypothetical protein